MADLTSSFCGIKSPNPFWLASAPLRIKNIMFVELSKQGGEV